MADKHTIVLLQFTMDKKSRTFRDYQGVPQALDGICGDFEHRLRELNPQLQNITYELSDLYSWIDNMPDMSALVFEKSMSAYVPCGKDWIKKKAFAHLKQIAEQRR